MSIEIIFYPKSASKKDLRDHLISHGFRSCNHLWEWPKGSLNYSWFEKKDYESFDGVEANIYPTNQEEKEMHGVGNWALHTRTRASASIADRIQQNNVIRSARKKFGGNFHNDCYGKNRYIRIDTDHRNAAARGIYLSYEYVKEKISAVKYALPEPSKGFENLVETPLKTLADIDPVRVLYKALFPFVVAALEHFFSQTFKILLKYDKNAQDKLKNQNRKVVLRDVIEITEGTKTIEDVIARCYSFQNIDSIHTAFKDWLEIDFWGLIRCKKKIGRKIQFLDQRFKEVIEFRHGVVHRFEFNLQLNKEQILEVLDLSTALIEIFVDYLEQSKDMVIRD